MPLPESVKRVAEIAQGRGVRVIGHDGEHRVLSAAESERVLDSASETAAKLMELDSQIRATVGIVASVAQNVNEIVRRVEAELLDVSVALRTLGPGQEKLERSLAQLTEAFYAPVIPVFDDKGNIKAAQRIRRST